MRDKDFILVEHSAALGRHSTEKGEESGSSYFLKNSLDYLGD